MQIRKRREPGAEVIEQRQHAAIAQSVKHAQRTWRVVEQRNLRDFDAQSSRIGADRIEQAQQALGKILEAKMAR